MAHRRLKVSALELERPDAYSNVEAFPTRTQRPSRFA
jgi:hypothetical protein